MLLDGNVPQTGEPFTVSGAPSAVAFVIGDRLVNINMGNVGMTGCTLHTMPLLTVGAVATNNSATLTLPVPKDTAFVGARFYEQAYVLDQRANAFGGALSTYGSALIGN